MEYTLKLNKYQRDNLLWMFEVARRLKIMNTGDWFGEIPFMLTAKEDSFGDGLLVKEDRPNVTIEKGVEQALLSLKDQIK